MHGNKINMFFFSCLMYIVLSYNSHSMQYRQSYSCGIQKCALKNGVKFSSVYNRHPPFSIKFGLKRCLSYTRLYGSSELFLSQLILNKIRSLLYGVFRIFKTPTGDRYQSSSDRHPISSSPPLPLWRILFPRLGHRLYRILLL